MKRIIERVVSQTIKEYINENFSRLSILKENDGDDMGVYKELDDKVFDNSIVAVALKNFDNFDCIINSKLIGEVV